MRPGICRKGISEVPYDGAVTDEEGTKNVDRSPLELLVYENPVTGVWRFDYQGQSIEVEPRHGYAKIGGRLYWDERLEGLTNVADLEGPPLEAIAALVSDAGHMSGKRRPVPIRDGDSRSEVSAVGTEPARPSASVEAKPGSATGDEPIEERSAPAANSTSESSPAPQAAGNRGRNRRRRERASGREQPQRPAAEPTPEDGSVLTTVAAADYVGLSPKTLETRRTRGGGPPFLKLGRRVVYRKEDLDAWLEAAAKRSTTDS